MLKYVASWGGGSASKVKMNGHICLFEIVFILKIMADKCWHVTD